MMNHLSFNLKKASRLTLLAVGILAACAPAVRQDNPAQFTLPDETEERPSSEPTNTSPPFLAAAEDNEEDDFEGFDFVPMLPFDGIRPIYEPDFVAAAGSPLHDEELVMGVAIQGEAKAYPVSVLRFREMVDDELGGIPILITW